MKLRRSHIAGLVFLVLLVVLGVRLAVVASRAETGRETVVDTCCNATIVFRRPEIVFYEPVPAERAEFWFAEIDRILAEHPDSAELAMGAAYMVDLLEGVSWRSPSQASECGSCRLELAERATRLEPENVDWWRMRAMLSNPPRYHADEAVNDAEWFDTLDECMRHDPQNALYDYLAAEHLYEKSTASDADDEVVVEDLELYELAGDRFDAAQKKEFLAIGQSGIPAMTALLRLSNLPYNDQAYIAISPQLLIYKLRILLDTHLCGSVPESVRNRDDASRQMAYLRDRLRVDEQLDWDTELLYSSALRSFHYYMTDQVDLESLALFYPEVVSKEEADRLQPSVDACSLNAMARQTAYGQVGNPEDYWQYMDHVIPVFGMQTALRLAMFLAVGGLLGWIAARWILRKQPQPERLGGVRHLVVWVVAFAAVFVFFGMGPAQVMFPLAQAWVGVILVWPIGFFLLFLLFRATVRLFRRWGEHPDRVPAISTIWLVMLWQATVAVICIAGLCFFLWIGECYDEVFAFQVAAWAVGVVVGIGMPVGWLFFLRKYRKRTNCSPLPHILAVCLLALATFAIAAPWVVYAVDHPWVKPWLGPIFRGGDYPWEMLCYKYGREGSWHVAFAQWALYCGAYTSVGLSLLLITIWHGIRCARAAQQRPWRYWLTCSRRRWGGLLDCLSRSAIAAAGAFLLIALLIGPVAVRWVEHDYQTKMTFAGNPDKLCAEVRAILPGIKEELRKEREALRKEEERIRKEAEAIEKELEEAEKE